MRGSKMKMIIGMLMMLVSCGAFAHHTVTHDVELAIMFGDLVPADLVYCKTKATMGKDARDQREAIVVNDQIADILKDHNETPKAEQLPWYVIVELQRIVRMAYRTDKPADEYYTEVFEECVMSDF